jgi:hypothetical protein
MGFGTAVSVGSSPWLVVGAPRADCVGARGATVADAGRIFIFQRVGSAWQYHQSFCASSPQTYADFGRALDVSGSWIIVGSPGRDSAGASVEYDVGSVEFFRLDVRSQQWSRYATVNGKYEYGRLGTDVAIDESLLVAGEPGVNNGKGLVRTWHVSGSALVAEPVYAPPGLADGDQYGARVDVYSSGCEVPGCTSFADAMVAQGGTQVHVAVRGIGTWSTGQALAMPAPAVLATHDVAIGNGLLTVPISIPGGSPALACPPGPAVLVFGRSSGNAYTSLGLACPPPEAMATFGRAVAVERNDVHFFVTSPDNFLLGSQPHPDPATFMTFSSFLPIQRVETQYELGLAPTSPVYYSYNDAYGVSMSHHGEYIAIGAPWSAVNFGTMGIGYVAIYQTPLP